MNVSGSPSSGPKTNSQKPFFSYTEAVVDFFVTIVGGFVLLWLDLPSYILLLSLGMWIVVIIGAKILRRNLSRLQR